jgi:hypothetical protein
MPHCAIPLFHKAVVLALSVVGAATVSSIAEQETTAIKRAILEC